MLATGGTLRCAALGFFSLLVAGQAYPMDGDDVELKKRRKRAGVGREPRLDFSQHMGDMRKDYCPSIWKATHGILQPGSL